MRDKGGKPAAGKPRRKKQEKGGARTFVTSLEEMALRDVQEEQKQSARKARRNGEEGEEGEAGSGEEDDSEEDESSSDEEGEKLVAFERVQTNSLFGFSQSATGPALEAKPKKKKAAFKVENPNLMPKQNKVMKAKDMQGNVEQQLSRRER